MNLKKIMSIVMLSLTLGGAVAPTVVSASEVIQTVETESQVEDNTINTNEESSELTGANSETNNTEILSTEKESNAPNEDGFVYHNDANGEYYTYELASDETVVDSDVVATTLKTPKNYKGYTTTLPEDTSFAEMILALSLLSNAHDYDVKNNTTEGYDEAINLINNNPINNMDIVLAFMDYDYNDYNLDTYITVGNKIITSEGR